MRPELQLRQPRHRGRAAVPLPLPTQEDARRACHRVRLTNRRAICHRRIRIREVRCKVRRGPFPSHLVRGVWSRRPLSKEVVVVCHKLFKVQGLAFITIRKVGGAAHIFRVHIAACGSRCIEVIKHVAARGETPARGGFDLLLRV